MNRTVLQIPVSPTLRREAEMAAIKQGYSSLQDFLRVVMNRLALGKLYTVIEDKEAIQLSSRAAKRYDKMYEDIKSGKEKVYTAKSVEDLMAHLMS